MKKLLVIAALAALSAGSANAAVTFSVDATFSTSPGGAPAGGTLTGTFTTDDALATILSYDLTASGAGSFAGFEYTAANSAVTASVLPSQYFQIDSAGGVNELRLYFSTPLATTGAPINPVFSYEHEPSGGNRFPVGAVLPASAAVPEPATWALLLSGFGLVGASMRRRSARMVEAI